MAVSVTSALSKPGSMRRQVGKNRPLRPLERVERLNGELRGLRIEEQHDESFVRIRKIVGGSCRRLNTPGREKDRIDVLALKKLL